MLKKDYKNDWEYIITKDNRTDYIVRKCSDKAGYYIIGYDHNAVMSFDLYLIKSFLAIKFQIILII